MYKRSPILALFALLAVAAIVAGCGGGGSSSGSTESTESQSGESTESSESSGSAPTKAAFIKEADAICTADEEELDGEIEKFAKENNIDVTGEEEPSKDQQEELFQEIVLPNIAKQGEAIADLTPPEGDESKIEDLTDTLSEEVSEAEDAGGLPDEDTLNGATEKAKAYGLKSCGS